MSISREEALSVIATIFNDNLEGIESGALSEDEAVYEFYNRCDKALRIKDCQAEFKRLSTEAGILKSAKAKREEWHEVAYNKDLTDEDNVKELKELGQEIGITQSTVNQYLRSLADEKGISLSPSSLRLSPPSVLQEIVNAFTADEVFNNTRIDVVNKIKEVGHFESYEKADSYYTRLKRAFGYEPAEPLGKKLQEWFIDYCISNKHTPSKEEITDYATHELVMPSTSVIYYVGIFRIATIVLNAAIEGLHTS